MPFQPGNQEAKKRGKEKQFRDALRMQIAAAEDGKKLRDIADKLLALALNGDMAAIKEVADRIDGKVPQGIAGIDEDEQLTPLIPIINLTIGPKPNPASQAGGGVSDDSD